VLPLILSINTGRDGGVSNMDRDGNNTWQIKVIGVTISTFETLPPRAVEKGVLGTGEPHYVTAGAALLRCYHGFSLQPVTYDVPQACIPIE
jgi:hypothetical protein